jgi:hypothetical protein
MVDTKPNISVRDMVDHVGALITSTFEDGTKRRPLPPGLSPPDLAASFKEDMPRDGMPVRDVLEIIEEQIVPSALNLVNPMTFGLMTPHSLPLPGISGMAETIERQVTLAEILYKRLGEIPEVELTPRSPTISCVSGSRQAAWTEQRGRSFKHVCKTS